MCVARGQLWELFVPRRIVICAIDWFDRCEELYWSCERCQGEQQA